MLHSFSSLLTLLSLVAASATTRVAVLEFGKGGAVRRTNVRDPETSLHGVVSFWNALHRTGRRQLQYAGMSVVPGLFSKADAGIVIGLNGQVDMDQMETLASVLSEESGAAVGHLEVQGTHCAHMMEKLDSVQEMEDLSGFKTTLLESTNNSGLSGIKTEVSPANAAKVDQELAAVLKEIQRSADENGTTIVVHLVVDEEDGMARRRRLLSRRLEDQQNPDNQDQQQQQQQQQQNNNNAEQNQGQNNNNNMNGQNNAEDDNIQNQLNQYSGYYGYGYYNGYGEWVTPYKTMFQIQYFNVVLWTSIALVVALFYTLYLMTNMPMEADTLLFGESAKMIGDD